MGLRLDRHQMLDVTLAHFRAQQEGDLRALRGMVHDDLELVLPGAAPTIGADAVVQPEVLGAVDIVERTGAVRVTRGNEVAVPLRVKSAGEEVDAVELLEFDADYKVTRRELIFSIDANAHTKATQRALEAYVEHVGNGDYDATMALFADDCFVEDPVGTPRHEGREAVEAFYKNALRSITKTRRNGPVRTTPEGPGAVAFCVDLDWDGNAIGIEVIDVMTVDDDGKITSMRAFWGKDNRHERG